MKKTVYAAVLGAILASAPYCSSRYYMIQSENPGAFSTRDYATIHIGWIDFDESRFKDYGYESRDEWVKGIRELNVDNLQEYTRTYMSGRQITGDESMNAPFPSKGDLLVKFTDVNVHKGEDSMQLKIHFIDTKSRAEIYRADLLLNRRSSWSEYSASGRILTMMDQLAYFLSLRIR